MKENNQQKEKLLALVGPTATGKSRLSVFLAQKLGGEIISADSMLVYRGMDIGTDKPGETALEAVRHHLIDILSPGEGYNVARFQAEAVPLVTALNKQKKLPLIVGGTGLYVKALLEGYEFSEVQPDHSLREFLGKYREREGEEALYEFLCALSPLSARQIEHAGNIPRVLRALEAVLSGGGISREKKGRPYDMRVIGLYAERPLLYTWINRRVEEMFVRGLVEETERLLANGLAPTSPALAGLGYREVVAYLAGKCTLSECKELVARDTRHFAKRQFTWFKKMPYIKWLEVTESTDYEKLAGQIAEKLAGWSDII